MAGKYGGYRRYELTTGYGHERARVSVMLELVERRKGSGTYRSTLSVYRVTDEANGRIVGYVWKQEKPTTAAHGKGYGYTWGSGRLHGEDPNPVKTRDKALADLLRKTTGYLWTTVTRHTPRPKGVPRKKAEGSP